MTKFEQMCYEMGFKAGNEALPPDNFCILECYHQGYSDGAAVRQYDHTVALQDVE